MHNERISKGHGATIVTILTGREFDQDTGGPKRTAAKGLSDRRGGTLAEFLLASPLRGTDLDIVREHDAPREVEL